MPGLPKCDTYKMRCAQHVLQDFPVLMRPKCMSCKQDTVGCCSTACICQGVFLMCVVMELWHSYRVYCVCRYNSPHCVLTWYHTAWHCQSTATVLNHWWYDGLMHCKLAPMCCPHGRLSIICHNQSLLSLLSTLGSVPQTWAVQMCHNTSCAVTGLSA